MPSDVLSWQRATSRLACKFDGPAESARTTHPLQPMAAMAYWRLYFATSYYELVVSVLCDCPDQLLFQYAASSTRVLSAL